MTTILGEHISVIRPTLPHKCIVYNKERFRVKCGRAKTNKENSGKVARVLIKLWDDAVFGIVVPATHLDVLEHFEIPYTCVKAVGWELESGRRLWR